MNQNRNHTPLIAAAVIAVVGFIPIGLGGETEPDAKQVAVKAILHDPVVLRIHQEIIAPLNQQAKRQSLFSRRAPVTSMSYDLVEMTEKKVDGERHFKVMCKITPLGKQGKAASKEFLKIRTSGTSGDLLVQHEENWVSPGEHPFLKLLPKVQPTSNVTP